jgi:hypothetical protein
MGLISRVGWINQSVNYDVKKCFKINSIETKNIEPLLTQCVTRNSNMLFLDIFNIKYRVNTVMKN